MKGLDIPEIATMRKGRPTEYGLYLEDLAIAANSVKQQTDNSYIRTIVTDFVEKWDSLSANVRARYVADASVLQVVYAESTYVCPKELLEKHGMNEHGELVSGILNTDESSSMWIKVLHRAFEEKKRLASERTKDEALLKPGEAVIARLRKKKPSAFGLFIERLIKEAESQGQQTDSSFLDQLLLECRDQWLSLSPFERACYVEDASALEAVYAESGYVLPKELLEKHGMNERGELVSGNLYKDQPPSISIKILREAVEEKKRLTSEKTKDEALLKPGDAVIARLRKKKPSAFGLFIERLIKEAESQGQQTDSSFLDKLMLESRDKWLMLSDSERARYAEDALALEAV